MQTTLSGSLRDKTDEFLHGLKYILLIILLTALSFVLGGELVLYTLFAALAVYVLVWGEDLLPLMPVVICAYIAPSARNNPGRNETSVFHGAAGGYLLILGGLIVLALIFRLIRSRRAFFTGKKQLLSGLLILSGTYLLSGIGSAGYSQLAVKNLLFALLQALSVLLPYWLFAGGVDWKRSRHDYLAWLGTGTGLLLLFQILWIYLAGNVITGGIIDRNRIYTGWGMYNNMGTMLAMMIPFVFYLAFTYRKGWLGILVGAAFLMGVCLTCSRSSMLVALLCYGACCCLMVFFGRRRKRNAVTVIVLAFALAAVLILFHRQILILFSQILDDAQELQSRVDIYQNGWREFLRNPLFGTTFYPAEGLSWSWSTTGITSFLPARWHNTVIQLLASTGIAGLLAYLLHRYQTVRLVLKLQSRRQLLLVFSVLVLLACSMTDCHFFNIGPTLFYSMLLAWLEKQTV